MKKLLKKTCSIFLVCCLILCLCCGVSATETGGRSQQFPDPGPGGGSTTLFTLNANNLTGLTHTSSFTKGNLPNGDTKLVASGSLTHTASSGLTTPTIRAGFGYFAAGSDTVVPEYYQDFSGASAYVYESVSISNLTSNTRYVGIIKNLSPSYGTVSGRITVYTY